MQRTRRSLGSSVAPSETEDSRSNDKIDKELGDDAITSEDSGHAQLRAQSSKTMYRQLQRLCVDDPGKFLQNWNPESSNRETRKLTRKIYSEGFRKHIMYDERGVYIKAGKDFCDCLEDNCPGCHMPCPKCSSPKCGHECRVSRRWTVDQVEVEGSDYVSRNKYK